MQARTLNDLLDEATAAYKAMQVGRWFDWFRTQKLHLLVDLRPKDKKISDAELADIIIKKFDELYLKKAAAGEAKVEKTDPAKVEAEKFATEKMRSLYTLLHIWAIAYQMSQTMLEIPECKDALEAMQVEASKLIGIHEDDLKFSKHLTKLSIDTSVFLRSVTKMFTDAEGKALLNLVEVARANEAKLQQEVTLLKKKVADLSQPEQIIAGLNAKISRFVETNRAFDLAFKNSKEEITRLNDAWKAADQEVKRLRSLIAAHEEKQKKKMEAPNNAPRREAGAVPKPAPPSIISYLFGYPDDDDTLEDQQEQAGAGVKAAPAPPVRNAPNR